MQKITRDQLLEILSRRKGTQFCGITFLSNPRCRKTGNPYKNVMKRVTANIEVGINYKKKLERAMVATGGNGQEADLHPRTWGQRIPNTPFVEHTKDGEKNFYLECIVNRVLDKQFFDETGPIREEDIKDFLPNKQERLVALSDINIKNIKSITVNGETYEVQET